MPDVKGIERVQRFRKSRRERGDKEVNVWIPGLLSTAIDQAVESGRFTIDVAGSPRDYILALPEGYDGTRPYRLVFTWHPGGGTAQQTAKAASASPMFRQGMTRNSCM